MVVKRCDKLIRDFELKDYEKKGFTCSCTTADDELYAKLLRDKLIEMVNEYMCSGSVVALAELTDVIRLLAEVQNISAFELQKIRLQLNEEKGSYKKRVVLKEIYY